MAELRGDPCLGDFDNEWPEIQAVFTSSIELTSAPEMVATPRNGESTRSSEGGAWPLS